ncbi:MAG: PKD domain-containing protein [bacterium]|nr:PKD domain-containing protein [bacterium]
MSKDVKKLLFLAGGLLLLTVLVVKYVDTRANAISGQYTNICGTGTSATGNGCGKGCDVKSGTCQGGKATVVKYTCNGKHNECRDNESSFSNTQSLGNVSCGTTVQIDVFSKNCRNNGQWVCNTSDLQDYLVWYSGDCSSSNPKPIPQKTCSDQGSKALLFKKPGENNWVNGSEFSSKIAINQTFEVNCFAQNGTALLTDAKIEVKGPDSKTTQLSKTGELRNYKINKDGTYAFRCISQSIANCEASGSLKVAAPVKETSSKGGTSSVITTAARTDSTHTSTCSELRIVSGNNALVPATTTLKARGSDSLGSIQRYKFIFGDGKVEESSSDEINHRYDVSGNFNARVEMKDSKGNWISSSNCETKVTVKAAPIESHKSACSDLKVTITNSGKAPATATYTISGYDTKGDVRGYKLDFGDGEIKESSSGQFEKIYTQATTYKVKAYVKDTNDNWVDGNNNCQKTIYITGESLTKQPETGTPTIMGIAALISGASGISLRVLANKRYNTKRA